MCDTYGQGDWRDGRVSFECTPDVVHDTIATVRRARHVSERLNAPNP